MKILHTADWHWEQDKLGRCLDSADFIITKARELKPDLHVIAGDWWNRRQSLSSSSAIIAATEALIALAEISPIVLIKGNNEHDQPGSLFFYDKLSTNHPIFVSEGIESIGFIRTKDSGYFCELDLLGNPKEGEKECLLHLFSYPTKAQFLADSQGLSIDEANEKVRSALRVQLMAFGMHSADVTCPVIFVGHLNLEGAVLSTGQTLVGQDLILKHDDLEFARADYYALGHIHKAQQVGTPNVRYAGSTYHCNFGEPEEKSMVIVEIGNQDQREHKADTIQLIPIPSRPMALHEALWSPETGFTDDNWEHDWTDAELRIRIRCTKEASEHLTDEMIVARYPGAHSYQIERIIEPQERIRAAQIAQVKTLPDKVAEWGRVIDREIPEPVLELAAETERSVAS